MIIFSQIRLPLRCLPQEAIEVVLRRLQPAQEVEAAHIHKVSVDARHGKPQLVYSVAVCLADKAAEAEVARRLGAQVADADPFFFKQGSKKLSGPVIVCGLGPAGLLAALELAQAGYAPIVLERGPDIHTRRQAVKDFEKGGSLQLNANIQFGEGGAGTFSDGKLTSRIKDPLCARVRQWLLEAGAPTEIAWRAKPHIGTDLLQDVFLQLREKITELGGEVHFNTCVTGLVQQAGRLVAVDTTMGQVSCSALVLAVGHSARDTFSVLHKTGLHLAAKPFSVGYRIEHLQRDIDEALYHEAAGHAALPPGEYQLSTQCGGRGVYTFCMCPGGYVVAAASEDGGVVTNGMSYHARAGSNANAAVVVGVTPQDFAEDAFRAIAFQRKLEQAAYAAGGGDFIAPAETVGSFLGNESMQRFGRTEPTYPRGVRSARLASVLPDELSGAIATGLRAFGRKLKGYDASDAVLTGVETRTSSPVRMPRRADSLESEAIEGVWPCGEGAGYAGGIMSAAVDGIRVATAIMELYAPPLN